MNSIFLCHSSKDKVFARKLADDLKKKGIKVWIDEAEIMVGDSLIDKIEEGIEEMEYLGVILSPNSVESNWAKKELNVAITKEIKGKKVKVLPIQYKECKAPAFLQDKKYADFTKNYSQGLSELLERLVPDDQDVVTKKEKISEYKIEIRRHHSKAFFPNGEYHYLVKSYENSVIELSEITLEYWHKNFPNHTNRETKIENKYLAPFEEREFIIQVNFLDFHHEHQKRIGAQIVEANFLQNTLILPIFKFDIDGEHFKEILKNHSAW